MILNLSNNFRKHLTQRGITVSFLSLYNKKYGFIRHTFIPNEYYDGYGGGVCLSDYPEIEFYEIPAYKRVISKEGGVEQWMKSIDKCPELFVDDALNLKKILLQQGPIEHERFVYHLCQILVNCYWFPNLTVDALLLFASNILYSTQKPKKSKRKWIFNKEDENIKQYLKENGPFKMMHDFDVCRRNKLVNENYNSNLSIDDNLKIMKNKGICNDKRTLVKYLKDNSIEYFDDNQLKEDRVMELKKEGKSVREISKMMKEEGFEKVSFKTIARIINRLEDKIKDLDDKIEHKIEVVNYRIDDVNEVVNNNAEVLEEVLTTLEKHSELLMELYNKNLKS